MFALPPQGEEPGHDAVRLADWIEFNLVMGESESLSIDEVKGELGDIPPDDSDDSERSVGGVGDSSEGEAEAAFMELQGREDLLSDRYALTVGGDVATLRAGASSLDVYRFLVLLRARHLYPRALGDDGVESGLLFEKLVTHALGSYVGSQPEHRVRFGNAGGFRGGGLPRSLPLAVMELAKHMHEESAGITSPEEGDYRADSVAWRPFPDGRPGQLVVIGQATISEGEWWKKQPADRWLDRRLIRFIAQPLRAVAFPETLSLTSRSRLDGVGFSSIPLDRLRLWALLRDEPPPPNLVRRINDWVDGMRGRLPRV